MDLFNCIVKTEDVLLYVIKIEGSTILYNENTRIYYIV